VEALPHRVPVIAVLGLAFKGEPPTRDQRGSLGIHLAEQLHQRFPRASIRTWDPESDDDKGSASAAAEKADVVIFANNHSRLANLARPHLAMLMRRGGTIFEFGGSRRGMEAKLPNDIDIRYLGKVGASRGDRLVAYSG
jgi:hypothetical protein